MACTLTVELPDDVYEALVRIAQKAKATPEGLVSEWVEREVQLIQNDPLEEVIGTIEGGPLDWVERHDEYIGENLAREAQGEEVDA